MRLRPIALALALALAAPHAALAQDPKAPTPPKSDDRDRIDKRPTEELVKNLEGGSPVEREIAEHELAARKKAVVGPVADLLGRTTSNEVRAATLRVLKKIADPAAADALVKVWKDENLPVELRVEAARALGAAKAVAAVPHLIDGLNDTSSLRVCEAARYALEDMASAAEETLVTRYEAERARGKDVREGVLYRLLLVLGRAGGERSRAAVVAALKTPDRDPRAVPLRHHAAVSLGSSGDKLAIEPLVAALEVEKDFTVAKYLARSLEQLTGETTLPPQGVRWRLWWEANRSRVLGEKTKYDPIPKEGVPKETKKP